MAGDPVRTAQTRRRTPARAVPGSFRLDEDHEDLRAVVADFAAAEIAPHAAAWDREHVFPVDVVRRMGELGLFGLSAPEEYGGAGDLTGLCVAVEEIGRVDQSLGITLEAAVGLGITPIARYGTEEQKQRWLPDLVAGRALAAFALTEADGGSDAGALRTTATLVDGHWTLAGSKQFITNSGTALTSVISVAARTGRHPDGRPEVSTLLVPAGTPGLVVGPAYDKLGWHASDTHPLVLEGARVPQDHLLGTRGRGMAQFLSTLDDGRVAVAALALGCIRACRDLALDHAGTRTAFGGPIGAKQGVAFPIADLDVMARTAHLMVYAAAALRDDATAGRIAEDARFRAEYSRAAAAAKLHATEAAVTATRVAAQVFGGYGFVEEYPIARFYRDAKILEIGEGTSEIQRLVIARGLGLPVA
ncbi:butyryl-CoA dehydrogenase [Friedmanniella endophytica]|uniref:Butyryl-CoA dehydrogenase n=1 Tax=Microlunatus kandeliicorticis TaxID=1759536 RepID=A0A7W3IQG3_9ACTN|nr:acyl-CoA dehydrogenase family protein [Microlunatus kandeliicorticis]MBA8793325.1 butyryl-CoA dehydrogenase [Microlunatus kandeliicorticis]